VTSPPRGSGSPRDEPRSEAATARLSYRALLAGIALVVALVVAVLVPIFDAGGSPTLVVAFAVVVAAYSGVDLVITLRRLRRYDRD
jgi:uncharacterized RDD family membrane protein YckC